MTVTTRTRGYLPRGTWTATAVTERRERFLRYMDTFYRCTLACDGRPPTLDETREKVDKLARLMLHPLLAAAIGAIEIAAVTSYAELFDTACSIVMDPDMPRDLTHA